MAFLLTSEIEKKNRCGVQEMTQWVLTMLHKQEDLSPNLWHPHKESSVFSYMPIAMVLCEEGDRCTRALDAGLSLHSVRGCFKVVR